jgi:rhodanese-related sulfurtransferase
VSTKEVRMPRTTISVEALRNMLEQGEPVTVLDVRTDEERSEWAIPGSIHFGAYEALKAEDERAMESVDVPERLPVVTVCGTGKTSMIAAEQLRAKDFTAMSLEGGMKSWSLAWNVAEVPMSGTEAKVVQVRRTGKG